MTQQYMMDLANKVKICIREKNDEIDSMKKN